MKKVIVSIIAAVLLAVGLSACTVNDADVASSNLSKAADQFEILRRIVFYNGITDQYIFSIEGYCSLGNNDPPRELSVTCKLGPGEFKKHFLGLSDNVTYFVEQLDSANVSTGPSLHVTDSSRGGSLLPSEQ